MKLRSWIIAAGILAVLGIVVCALPPSSMAPEKSEARIDKPREGDVVFQSFPHSPLTDAIEGVTESPYSHCGIAHRAGGKWVVIEAVGPVQETPWAEWVARGREQSYAIYRLKPEYRAKIPAFVAAARTYEGRPYDFHYDFDDEAIYCSELVYKAFRTAAGEELGKPQALGELKWKPYVEVIKQLEDGQVPLDRQMITPRALAEAKQLEEVYPMEGGAKPPGGRTLR